MKTVLHLLLPIQQISETPGMKRQLGLSLVELMIAITLGLILTIAVVQVFLGTKVTFNNQQALSRIQEAGRLGIEFMSKELRMTSNTGFRGRGVEIVNKIGSPGVYQNYDEGFSLVDSAAGITPLAGTKIFIVRGVFTQNSSVVRASDNGSLKLIYETTEAAGCAGGTTGYNGLCAGDDLIVSDYAKSITFHPTSLTVAGTDLTVSYSEGWGGNLIQNDEYFDYGARVSKISWVAYYIAVGASGRPGLFHRINGQNVELLEGVRDFKVAFALASDPADFTYMSDSDSPDWGSFDTLAAVRLELLVESATDQMVDTPQTYNFGGEDVVATDRRIYQVFSTDIAARNFLP